MAKNTNFVSHKKSKQKNQDGTPQLPLASALVEGEIAINFAENVETLSIKNESGNVVTFSSDNYYSEKKLGSGFTGANSAVTVTEAIEENEEIVATALNDLNERKLDASAYTPTDLSDYYTKEEVDERDLWVSGTGLNAVVLKNSSGTASGDFAVAEGNTTQANGDFSHAEGYSTKANNQSEHASGQYNVSSSGSSAFGYSGNTLFSVGNGTADDARHNAFEIMQNGDIYIVSGGTNIKLQDNIGGGGGSITVDQVLDNTTSASTNPVSSKAVYDAVTDNELVWTNAYVTLSGVVSSHTENTNIHLANGDREKIDSIGTLSGTVTAHTADTNIHLTTTEKGQLHTHSNKTYIDGITGTIGTMAYEDKTSYSSATEVNNALSAKVNSATYTGHTADTTVHFTTGTVQTQIDNSISGKVNTSDIVSAITPSNSASTAPIATKVVAENELVMTNALTDLDDRKLDASAYTPTDLSDYYTKSQTSGATELSTAFAEKVDGTTFSGHTADTTIHSISVVSAVTVSADLTNVTCPTSITGSSKSGAQAIVIYQNGSTTTDYNITVSTSYKSPDGQQIDITCPKNGYCEISYINIGGTIYVRGT